MLDLEQEYQEESVEGKVVLISGGTTGIGRATAVMLAWKGAKVFIFARHQRELDDAIADGKKVGGEICGCLADVTKYEDVVNIFDQVKNIYGRLDIMINNAGTGARSILRSDYDEWMRVIKTNYVGYLLCTRFAVDILKEQGGGGHIINIGSMSAHTRDADTDLYVSTKSAVDGFNESLRKEINRKCIKMTLIEPGSVGTDLIGKTPAEQQELEEHLELLKAEDIARAIYYALTQPKRTDILTIQLRSHKQVF
ncbi:MAG: SDR family oxidoreductase [Patescibacteria group bacterium]